MKNLKNTKQHETRRIGGATGMKTMSAHRTLGIHNRHKVVARWVVEAEIAHDK